MDATENALVTPSGKVIKHRKRFTGKIKTIFKTFDAYPPSTESSCKRAQGIKGKTPIYSLRGRCFSVLSAWIPAHDMNPTFQSSSFSCSSSVTEHLLRSVGSPQQHC